MDYLHSPNMRDVFKKVYANNDRGHILQSELSGAVMEMEMEMDESVYNAYKLEEVSEEDLPFLLLKYAGETILSYTENAMKTVAEAVDSGDFQTAAFWARQMHTFDKNTYSGMRMKYMTKERIRKIMAFSEKRAREERNV